jgi:hypothetical protein
MAPNVTGVKKKLENTLEVVWKEKNLANYNGCFWGVR